jgi:phage terminase large subunit-like protein
MDGKWMLVMNEMLTIVNEFNQICMKMDEIHPWIMMSVNFMIMTLFNIDNANVGHLLEMMKLDVEAWNSSMNYNLKCTIIHVIPIC